MTPQEIEKLVDDEVARRRLTEVLNPPKPVWETVIRHPLFLTVFAFIVTTIIGGYYDSVLKDRADARAAEERARSQATADAQAAVQGLEHFATLVFERQTFTDLLRSAIARGDGYEARHRKTAYDKLYVRWNVELTLNLRRLRSYLGDSGAGRSMRSRWRSRSRRPSRPPMPA